MERKLGPLTSVREKLPGEDWIAVKCSCGKVVAAPRGWGLYVSSKLPEGCAHVKDGLPVLPEKKVEKHASKDRRTRGASERGR